MNSREAVTKLALELTREISASRSTFLEKSGHDDYRRRMHHSRQASTLTIDQQHAAILASCDELLATLRAGGSAEAVGASRMKLAGLLHANLASEELELIGPIRRLALSERPRHFTEMSEEAADLRARYSAHVGQWTLRAIAGDATGYRRAATALVEAVTTHLNKKRGLLPEWRASFA